MERAKIRLCVDHPLGEGQAVPLNEAQAHYLFGVMRQGLGARVALFNGRDGEWTAEVAEAAKKRGTLVCLGQAAPQLNPPDLWLIFAPIKKERTDFIVEKAAELGCARILPVQTEFTNAGRVKQDRLQAHAMEAAEQCLGTFVPTVDDMAPLRKLLDGWDPARRILWADESLAGAAETLAGLTPGPWAILIGPEGGFSEPERAKLRALPFVTPVSLGPRILRADTAACAAITLWQAALGDWR
ncbi:16S rRNA (uracil(1498)-N(3))-methyltransferase [Sinirhodobacter sp. WL0062]|uniref:Ribosomal RNA small subunit methyltransferase E n=1 Tax=Rhodobacter flavimaris TaxID=2907145 RepID=A0ABS8Z0Z3_9RHOB|nr:16S rRNA (uracil(1498)-N(3))-methyltransferase [Sinirhodobacter sp. WL0062]MCE5974706.1 16S rRNA (uracil(1498)-N(3))-methyltransferase [Sinirhodobacter sp. WL0062]